MFFTGMDPTRAYADDAGFDLRVVGEHWIAAHAIVSLPLATTIAAPEGMWGLLVGRSSTFRDRHLLINPGIIDHGYTGPLFAVAFNMGRPVEIKDGERLCQWIPMQTLAMGLTPIEVATLPDRPRGHNGFGSSGS